jgi:hypothetical protein
MQVNRMLPLSLIFSIFTLSRLSYAGVSGWWVGGGHHVVGPQPLPYDQQYLSEGDVYLGPTANRVCFLTGIGGQFHGGGETVQVYQSTCGSSTCWYLGGQALSQGVWASANCVGVASTADYTREYPWSQGQSMQRLNSTSNYVCFLTSIAGHFAGGGEYVTVGKGSGFWYITGGSQQQGVAAGARCVRTTTSARWNDYSVGPYVFVGPGIVDGYMDLLESYSGNFGSDFTGPTDPSPKPGPACFLGSVSGKLDEPNYRDRVYVHIEPGTSTPFNWWSTIAAYSGYLRATWRCLESM